MATSDRREKFFIAVQDISDPKAQRFDLITIEKYKDCSPRSHPGNIYGGRIYPTRRTASGGGFTKIISPYAAAKFWRDEMKKVMEITAEEFDILRELDAARRQTWYAEILTKRRLPLREPLAAGESRSVLSDPNKGQIFLAMDNITVSLDANIPRGLLFFVKASGSIFDAVTNTDFFIRLDSTEKIWDNPLVMKVPNDLLAFLEKCDDRVSVIRDGQLQILAKAKQTHVNVLVMDGETFKEGCIVGIRNDDGLLSVKLGDETLDMSVEKVFDAIPPKWVTERKHSYELKSGDSIHLPGIGFGSFEVALMLPGHREVSCVAQLVSKDYQKTDVPRYLRPYLSALEVRHPNLAVVHPLKEVIDCSFYILEEDWRVADTQIPKHSLLAWNFENNLFDIRSQMPLGSYLSLPRFANLLPADEVTAILLSENQDKPVVETEGEREAFHRDDQNAENAAEVNVPQYVLEALTTDSLDGWKKGDVIETSERWDGEHLSYGFVKAVMKPPNEKFPLVAAELLTPTETKSSPYLDNIKPYLQLLGVEPERAVVRPAGEFLKCKIYILLEKYESFFDKINLVEGNLLAWNASQLLTNIDWQIHLQKRECVDPPFKVEEISQQQFPFLFRISDPSQRLAVHKSGLVDRVLNAQLPLEKVLFLSERCDSEQKPFGEVGVVDRFQDGFVFVQVDGQEEERTHLGRICDINSAVKKNSGFYELRHGDSVIVVQAEDRLCGCVVGVFRLPWQKEDVVIVQHLVGDPGGAPVPEEILQLLPSEERRRTAAYPASTVEKCKFRLFNRNHETSSLPEGTLIANHGHRRFFCFHTNKSFENDYFSDFYSEEISQQQFPFLFRISDPSQRLAVHKSGLVDRVHEGHLLGEKVLFLSERCDSEQKPFGEVGVVDRFQDGFVFVQVDGQEEERTHLGRVCDGEALKKDSGFYELRHGDSVIVVQAEDRLCGCVVGVFRLPWQKEDVVIVQHLMDEKGGASVPEEILQLLPEKERRPTAAYTASTVKKCDFFICNDTIQFDGRHIDIPTGSLLTKSCDGSISCIDNLLDLGEEIISTLKLDKISQSHLSFLLRILDPSQRFAVHRSFIIHHVLTSPLPVKNILFLPKGCGVEQASFGNFGDITHYEDGFVFVQVKKEQHQTTLDKVFRLEEGRVSLLGTFKELQLDDIVEFNAVGNKMLGTIHAIQKFPGHHDFLVVMKRLHNGHAMEVIVCPVKSLKKVARSSKNKEDRGDVDTDPAMKDLVQSFEYVPSSSGLPSIEPGEVSKSVETDYRETEDTHPAEPMDIDRDEPYMIGDFNKEQNDINECEEQEREKMKNFVETQQDSKFVRSSSRDDDKARIEAEPGCEAARSELQDDAEEEGGSTTQKALSYEEISIEEFPHDLRVCFIDEAPPRKVLAGTVKWTGKPRVVYSGSLLAVIVLDERHRYGTNGCFLGERLVTCTPGRAMLIDVGCLRKVQQIQVDDFVETLIEPREQGQVIQMKSGTVTVNMSYESTSVVFKNYKVHEVRKIKERRKESFSPLEIKKFLGDKRGIQGKGNSCYLDSLLFSLFAFSDVAKKKIEGITQKGKWYEETYDSLVRKIATTLRTRGYVQHSEVQRLRQLMADASGEKKFMDSARDISECMETLFQKMLQLDPFVLIGSLNSEVGTFVIETLLVEGVVDTVTSQICLEYAALCMDFAITSVKDCLMIQLPRDRSNASIVVPSKLLDLQSCQGVNSESRCSRCHGSPVTHLDRTLFDRRGLLSTFLCAACARFRPDASQSHFLLRAGRLCERSLPDMHLSAVICIESSHYNSFVRTGGTDPKWVFFDSMADQRRETLNISKIIAVDVDDWIHGALAVDNFVEKFKSDRKESSEVYRRLFQYPYMFIYHT